MTDLAKIATFARRYAQAWSSHDPESVAAFFAERGSISINDGPPAVGRAAIAEEARGFMTTFPDMIVTIDKMSREPDGTKFHWTLAGTKTPGSVAPENAFESAATNCGKSTMEPATWTGKPERVDEQGGESINDGLIAESKGHFDSAEYESQRVYELA
jgi:uncharacterized protein (TIGR02246 family)